MAVEYANILRTLNMMMESRARREDAKTDASLRALQMAQQQERFDKELAFKREQFGLQQQQFEAQQQDKFMDRAKGLAQVALTNWGKEASTVWDSTFNGWYGQFLDGEEKVIIKNREDALESLMGNGDYVFTGADGKPITMTKEAADDILTQMGDIYNAKINGSDVTSNLDILFTKYEQVTGATLTNYDHGKQFKAGYDRLIAEIQQVELGDYDFNILRDQMNALDDVILDPSLLGEDESNILTPDVSDELTLEQVLSTLDAESMNQFINVDGNDANILARKQNIIKGIPVLNEWAVKVDEMTVPYDADDATKFQNLKGQMNIINAEIQSSHSSLKQLNSEIKKSIGANDKYIEFQNAQGIGLDMNNPNIYDIDEQEAHNREKMLLEIQLDVLNNKKEQLTPAYNKAFRGW